MNSSAVMEQMNAMLSHDFAALMSIVCRRADVAPKDLLSRSRDMRLCFPRHIICTIMRERGYSYSRIGRCLLRDHATVIYGIRVLENALRVRKGYENFVAMYEDIKKEWEEYLKAMEKEDGDGKF